MTKKLPFSLSQLLLNVLIGGIALGIGTYFRLYPLIYYSSEESLEKATILVLTNLRRTVEKTIEQQNPQLSLVQKKQLIQSEFDTILHSQNDKARATILKVAGELEKNKTWREKRPFLLESDSFYYLSLTENILATGKISDTIKGSKYFNSMMLYPLGHWEPLNLHPYVGYFLHKIITRFQPQTPVMFSVSFTPLVVAALSLIPFFIIAGILRCSALSSLVGSIYFVLAPIYLKRSTFGWYDNDPYNTLFPLMILLVQFIGFRKIHQRKFIIFYGLLTSLLIPLYALFWHGWVFLESIIFVAALLILLFNHFVLKKKIALKNLLFYFGSFLFGSFIGIGLIFGIQEFFILFKEGWEALHHFLEPQLTLWPNLYINVGELHRASLMMVIDQTGGYVFFVIAVLGLLVSFLKILRLRNEESFIFIVILVFLFFSLVMTLGAQRFALLCLVPLSLLFLLGTDKLLNSLKTFLNSKILQRQLRYFVPPVILLLTTVSLLSLPIWKAHIKTPSLLTRIFNDTWNAALLKIRNQTPQESIIHSWWPPGHFIKTVAKRRVTFDGATINQPQAYWLANVFLSQNEQEALGLLRMLNSGANQATEYLVNKGYPLSQAVGIIKSIVSMNRTEAQRQLKQYLKGEQPIEELLTLTHQSPPPSYLFIYNDLIEKNIELSYVGKWDFKKVEEINQDPSLKKQIPPVGSKEYVQFLWDISGGYPRYSGIIPSILQSEDKIIFDHNIIVDLKTKQCFVNSKVYGEGVPLSLFYLENDDIVEIKYPKVHLPYSAVIFKQNASYRCVLLDNLLAKSLIFKLFFFEGKGLKYIEPFIKEMDMSQRTQIYVYKINWEKFLKDLNEAPPTEPVVPILFE